MRTVGERKGVRLAVRAAEERPGRSVHCLGPEEAPEVVKVRPIGAACALIPPGEEGGHELRDPRPPESRGRRHLTHYGPARLRHPDSLSGFQGFRKLDNNPAIGKGCWPSLPCSPLVLTGHSPDSPVLMWVTLASL